MTPLSPPSFLIQLVSEAVCRVVEPPILESSMWIQNPAAGLSDYGLKPEASPFCICFFFYKTNNGASLGVTVKIKYEPLTTVFLK